MVKRTNQPEHDRMVESVAKHLLSSGFTAVKADVPDHTRPNLIIWVPINKGHIPDLTATISNQGCIFEVETDDSINDEHTKDQWALFAEHAHYYASQFILVVPKGSEAKARKRLHQLRIRADNVWTVD